MNDRFGRSRPKWSPAGQRSALLIALALVTTYVTAAAFVCATAHAATVVVVRGAHPSAVASEATVRLRGELVSAGFSVRLIDAPVGSDIRASLEHSAAEPEVEAVVAIVGTVGNGPGESAPDSAELWVIDRVTGKTVVRRVPYQPGSPRGAEILSIRALELLRASFIEVALAARQSSRTMEAAPPPEVTRWTDAALSTAVETRWPSTWAIEAGGCLLGSLQGMAPTVMPMARVQHTVTERFVGRIGVAGLGTTARLTHQLSGGDVGRAEVARQFGVLEGAARWRTAYKLQPMVSFGVGVQRVTATGQTLSTYEGSTDHLWSLLGDLGAGLHLSLRGRLEIALEIHLQGAWPYPVIRFVGADVATEGRPTLMSSLTVLAWM